MKRGSAPPRTATSIEVSVPRANSSHVERNKLWVSCFRHRWPCCCFSRVIRLARDGDFLTSNRRRRFASLNLSAASAATVLFLLSNPRQLVRVAPSKFRICRAIFSAPIPILILCGPDNVHHIQQDSANLVGRSTGNNQVTSIFRPFSVRKSNLLLPPPIVFSRTHRAMACSPAGQNRFHHGSSAEILHWKPAARAGKCASSIHALFAFGIAQTQNQRMSYHKFSMGSLGFSPGTTAPALP